MFFKRSVLPLLICLLSFVGLRAQNTLGYTEADVHFRNGVELFEKSNYAAAKQEFRYYLEKRPALLNTNDYTAVTAEYYMLMRLRLNWPWIGLSEITPNTPKLP
jgi:hypothetical protein